tara:strand:+ start:459 stop:755 length:297 start_codon:yes stop_codon:yes gene_type:complete
MKTIILIFYLFFLSSCNTVKTKTDEIIKKENNKLSKFIGKPLSILKKEMGMPIEEIESNNADTKILIYKTKKYGIYCERKFEVDSNAIVIGYTSKGCF